MVLIGLRYNEDFKNYSKDSEVLKLMLNVSNNDTNYTMIYYVYQEEWKFKNLDL